MTTILERMARRVIRAERVAVRRWAIMNQLMWFTSGGSAEQRCEAYYRAADRRDRAIRAFDAYGTGPASGSADLLASGRWVGGGGAAPEVTVVRA